MFWHGFTEGGSHVQEHDEKTFMLQQTVVGVIHYLSFPQFSTLVAHHPTLTRE
jgi:hypothetical protein